MCTVLANSALTLKIVKDRIDRVLYFMDFLKRGVMKGVLTREKVKPFLC